MADRDGSLAGGGGLPTLVIAGAPKSGTSSIFRWLSDHPQVLGSSVKETYYFVDPGTHMHVPEKHFLSGGIDGYRQFFPNNGPQRPVIVEATPSYLYSDLALREMPFLPSRPHFLFLLREPASQIRSTFRYFQSNWNWIDRRMSFRGFLKEAESESGDFNGNELARYAIRNARYVEFLRRWRVACGAERIHVSLFEDTFADPAAFMRNLARKLGIDAAFYDGYEFPAENQTYSVRSQALQRVNIALRSWLPQGAFYNSMRSLYRQLNTRAEAPESIGDDMAEAELARRFEGANLKLAEEFDLDLGAWDRVRARRSAKLQGMPEEAHVAG